MEWTEDRQRMAEMGPGPLLLCAFLLCLAVFGVYQMALVWRISEQFEAAYGNDLAGMIMLQKALAVARVVLLVAAVFGLYFSNSRMAVYFAVLVLIFSQYRAVAGLYSSVTSGRINIYSLLQCIDVVCLLVPVAYLAISKEIDRLYRPGTRHFLTVGVRNGWQRLRGRPTANQVEAIMLDETFK